MKFSVLLYAHDDDDADCIEDVADWSFNDSFDILILYAEKSKPTTAPLAIISVPEWAYIKFEPQQHSA